MIDQVKDEAGRIDSRFLEPACGSGNFLRAVLNRKFGGIEYRYGKSEFEKKHYALFALMCIYGIELLQDNVEECRKSLLEDFNSFLSITYHDVWSAAASSVLNVNIIHGDALTIKNQEGLPIEFPEWGYLGSGKYQRRDFRFDSLTQRASIQGTLFELLEEHQLFVPTRTYPPMTVQELAK